MPIYSYKCKKCELTVERFVKMEDRDTAQKCDACGGSLSRGLDKPGMVWSPTRNNGYSF
jgi:putative FmdB family regulatory protein